MGAGLKYADRVQETTTTTGTGTVTLAGAVADYQAFSTVFTNATTIVTYVITDNASNWEVGRGTYTLSGTTLSRDVVYESSNSNALVNFPSGTKYAYLTEPAAHVADMAMTSAFAMRWVGR